MLLSAAQACHEQGWESIALNAEERTAGEAVHLYRVDRATGERSTGWTNKVELGPGVLPLSVRHTVETAAS